MDPRWMTKAEKAARKEALMARFGDYSDAEEVIDVLNAEEIVSALRTILGYDFDAAAELDEDLHLGHDALAEKWGTPVIAELVGRYASTLMSEKPYVEAV